MRPRLLYVNEHQVPDYVPIPPAPTTVYGRCGHPLKLAVGERAPRAQCRIYQKEGAWYLENRGEDEQTLLNGAVIKSRILRSGDEIHCGTLRARFEEENAAKDDSELLLKAQKELLEAAQATAELNRKATEQKLAETQAENLRLDAECARLRKEASQQQPQQENLRTRIERLQQEFSKERQNFGLQIEQLTKEAGQLREETARMSRTREQIAIQLQATEAQAKHCAMTEKQLALIVEQQKQQLGQLQSELEALVVNNRQLSEKNQHLVEIREAAERSVREAHHSRVLVEKELRALQARLEKEQTDLTTLESLRLEASRARRDLEDCRSKLRRQSAEQLTAHPPVTVAGEPPEFELAREAASTIVRVFSDMEVEISRVEEHWSNDTAELSTRAHRKILQRDLSHLSTIARTVRDTLIRLERVLLKR